MVVQSESSAPPADTPLRRRRAPPPRSPRPETAVDPRYAPQRRAERLIAVGRVGLSLFSLAAIWIDPSEPAKYAQATYLLLAGFVLYSAAVAIWVWRADAALLGLRLPTHVFDLVVFSALVYLTAGSTSPFFVFFVFSLLCATLRWQWQGVLWTAAAALAVFFGIGVYAAEVLDDPQFELNRFIIRSAYLVVVAFFLAYLGAYERHMRRELSQLAAWPGEGPRDFETLLREVLEHAARVLNAPRVLMTWEEHEEPWLHLALWEEDRFERTRESSEAFQPLVAEALAESDFLSITSRDAQPTALHTSPSGLLHWRGAPLHPRLQERLDTDAVLSLRLRGARVHGRLFSLDKPWMTSDDLMLGAIVARQVGARLDHFYMLQWLREAAVAQERMRVARDLHDGLLQSLTGLALQLETVQGLLRKEPQIAHERLLEVQNLIVAEQRDLRSFILELRNALPELFLGTPSLASRLRALQQKVETVWGLHVHARVDGHEELISDDLAYELHRIVQEALVNAARHANATRVDVDVQIDDHRLRVVVDDDGHGFSFKGRYDLAALGALALGPVSLKERILALGGSLEIESSDEGARLEIELPLPTADP